MLPLSGIKVIEFCEVASGPFCGMLLADMGAEVIKVERDGQGDSMRQWPPLSNGYSENFASLNRGKKSIALNLKQPADQEVARRLILSADAVVENYRPGVMEKNGLGYAALSKLKPSLVYCSISAFGQSGPRSHEGGFDLTIQAVGGVMSVTGEPDGPPVKCGVPISDFSAGLYAAFSIASTLRQAMIHGRGEHIDISMLGATLAIAALQTSEFFGTGVDPKKLGSAHPRNAPYQAFKAKDGYFAMAAGNDKLWRSVCELVDRADLVADPRFIDTVNRTRNQTELKDLLEEIFAAKPTGEWIAAFTAVGVPCGAINAYSDILADPQVQHMGWVQETTLPSGVTTRTFGSPVMLSGRGIEIRAASPALGEHRDDILKALNASIQAAS